MSGARQRSWLAGALLAALAAGPTIAASAQTLDKMIVKQHIEDVLAQPKFSTQRADREYRYIGDPWWDDEPSKSSAEPNFDSQLLALLNLVVTIIARFTEALMWTLLVTVIVLLIVFRKRWKRFLPIPSGAVHNTSVPSLTMGLDVRPASLPDDVAATAWAMWGAGDGRGCVSLLYRGALARLIARFGLELPASATESDCVGQIGARTAPALAEFFRELTLIWQGIAYAGRDPSEAQIKVLCDHWRQHFGAPQ